MELWATGFNAWNQLQFEDVAESGVLSRDLLTFKCVARDESIQFLSATFSGTLIHTSSGNKLAGHDHNLGLLFPSSFSNIDLPSIAIAGNDKIAEYKQDAITQYGSTQAYREGKVQSIQHNAGEIKQLVANETTFTALSTNGEVLTWGDGRYEPCLGREVTNENPASLPGIVPDLLDLPTGPITKISSGGYVTAALTSGKDLYVWGGRPGQEKMLEEFGEGPMPVDVQGRDVVDVAVGFNHILVLTVEGSVFVAGVGENGQLGLGEVVERKDWTEVELFLMPGQKVESVYAGYRNSYILLSAESDVKEG